MMPASCVVILLLKVAVILGCPLGYDDFLSTTGSCLYMSTTPKDWFSSRDACIADGGELVRVTSPEVASACEELLQSRPQEKYWIGLNDLLVFTDYRYPQGDSMTWNYFGIGTAQQPNDMDGTQACILADNSAQMLVKNTWEDKRCYEQHLYACQLFPDAVHKREGVYIYLPSSNTLINTQVSQKETTTSLLTCLLSCQLNAPCDGYAYHTITSQCRHLSLASGVDVVAVQSELAGSDVYIRRG